MNAAMNLPQIIDQMTEETGWQSKRCPRCNSWHVPGHCPALRGLRVIIEHLPCCGWRGHLCLPTTSGDIMVRREVPSGLLPKIARGEESGNVSGIDGEVGFLPLILSAMQTPQGQQAMSQLGKVAEGSAATFGPSTTPMAGVAPGMMGMFGSMMADKMAAKMAPTGYGGAPPPQSPPPGYGPSQGQQGPGQSGAPQGQPPPSGVSGPAGDSSPVHPAIAHMLASLPDNLPAMPAMEERVLGEQFGELPGEFLRAMGPNAQGRLAALPVPEPHAVLHRMPGLFGGYGMLAQGEHLANTWPEFAALGAVLGIAKRILDAEAGRLLGDPEAEEALRQALDSRERRVRAALSIAQSILG